MFPLVQAVPVIDKGAPELKEAMPEINQLVEFIRASERGVVSRDRE